MSTALKPRSLAHTLAVAGLAPAIQSASASMQPVEFTFSGPIHFRSQFVAAPWELTGLGQRMEIKVIVNLDAPDQDPSTNVGQYALGPGSVRNLGNDVGLTSTSGLLLVRNDERTPPTNPLVDDIIEFSLPLGFGQRGQVFFIKTQIDQMPSLLTSTSPPTSIDLSAVDGGDLAIAHDQWTIAARIDRVQARVVPTPGAIWLAALGGPAAARCRWRSARA